VRLEKDIKVSQDMDVVFQIFSDPAFTIPKVFPGVNSIKTEGEKFEAEGKFFTVSYKVKGRVYIGVNEIRFIYDSDKGSGTLYVKKKDENTLQIILDHGSSLYGNLGKRFVSSNLDNLAKNIDEIIRLERIKRKI